MATITLHSEALADGSTRTVWLSRLTDGGIAIEGQDLGDLSRFFGAGVREYEWATSVTADELPKLRTALGGSATADIEDLVKDRFSGVRHGEFRQFCEDHDIRSDFWSRFGE